jgi:hypothetical protein
MLEPLEWSYSSVAGALTKCDYCKGELKGQAVLFSTIVKLIWENMNPSRGVWESNQIVETVGSINTGEQCGHCRF